VVVEHDRIRLHGERSSWWISRESSGKVDGRERRRFFPSEHMLKVAREMAGNR